jgi:sugar phosphate isomerase/epimerase
VDPRLSVSALSSMRLTLDEDLRLWRDLGVRTVGLFLPKLEVVGLDAAVDRVRAAGLAVSSVACQGFSLDEPATWPERRAHLAAAVDAAAALDASCLFVTAGRPGALGFEASVDALGAALGPVQDRARGRGLELAVEHTNPMRRDVGFIHTLADMVEVARGLGVGVVVELTNCWAERGLEATIADGVDTFRLVQASDYVVGTVCATERAVPGDGDIPLAALLGTMQGAGYGGYFELEMLGPRVEAEGYRAAIARALVTLEPMLGAPR